MDTDLSKIQEAAKGLFYLSESDYPFEAVQLQRGSDIQQQLLQLSAKPAEANIEKTSLQYFFRNMVRIDPNATSEQHDIAKKFLQLQDTLNSTLKDIEVWRIGTTQIDAFIIGKLKDGSVGGLRTKLVET